MPASDIVIKGAREHNLQDVELVLPRNQLICLTGVSGSGKSSLAFDTLYAEGQRRYIESLSSFARQFLGQMPKPDVDLISGLSPSISISQKSAGNNPRSTVGTITEIYDYLRVMFARVGKGHCPKCSEPITAQSRDEIIGRILAFEKNAKYLILAPVVRAQKGSHNDLFEDLLKQGFVRARVDGEIVSLNDKLNLDRQLRHDVEVVIDRLVNKGNIRGRLAEAVDMALKLGKGNLVAMIEQDSVPDEKSESANPNFRDVTFSADYACVKCGISFDPPSPQMFSFNSPQGMCLTCDGLGNLFSFDPELLVTSPDKSFKKGAIELLGTWKDIGRWKRHIFAGVAETVERIHEVEEGTMLETPWQDLPEKLQQIWLYGTGDQHITFTWRGGSSPMKYGGTFSGLVPDLTSKYQELKSKPVMRKYEEFMSNILCPECHGGRLSEQARSVRVTSGHEGFTESPSLTLPEICTLPVSKAAEFFSDIDLDATRMLIASEALKEIRSRLGFLINVGLDYLTLDRSAPTLSGGEAQRIRLAGQIGSGLVGVLYILDEPSIGLHARDNDRLISTLLRLRDMGNTVVVVEHDEDTMWAADHIIDFGPGPGVRGGEVVVEGPPAKVVQEKRSVTGQYLGRSLTVPNRETFRQAKDNQYLKVKGARHNNLKNVTAEIPLGCFVCVTGVSGSGKSSLVNGILVEALRRDLNRGLGEPGDHDEISGIEYLDKLIAIDQSPIGRTPRSNPGTYIKVFDEIRSLFTQLPDSKKRGFKPGRFSFNVKGGRCEACEGNGANKLEMDFLADIWVTCPVCQGHRFNHETLQVKFKGYSISDILEMEVGKAIELFENIPKIHDKLLTLHNVGLDYLQIGQPSPTLSGGEAQRIKLARELVKKSTGQTLYLLDEPTTGLHFADIRLLLDVLQRFADAGNTVLVVEHNLDVIQTADWIIDIGPEGGAGGGKIVASGPPAEVAKCKESYTGRALKKYFEQKDHPPSLNNGSAKSPRKRNAVQLAKSIKVQGATQHNLRSVDAEIDRDKMTVFCGPSGSGKSSLAMDTIYAEGQRRYVESLSSYARQFVNQMQKPKLEHVEGLSPAIAIEQKNLGSTPRSTVGTVTEIYDYLRILMARLGTNYCPNCDVKVGTQTSDQIIAKILDIKAGSKLYLMAPVAMDSNTDIEAMFADFQSNGFARVRVDGFTHAVDSPPSIDRRRKHEIELVVDRVTISPKSASRIAESVEAALAIGKGVLHVAFHEDDRPENSWQVAKHSQHLACEKCDRSFERLSPHNFSFNSQLGWCEACEGLGVQTGANPAALISDPSRSLAQGAIELWPGVASSYSKRMIQAFGKTTGFPIDKPIDELTTRERRLLLHGTGDQWIDVPPSKKGAADNFRFQYKGLYPALDEAARTSFSFRRKLESFVDDVECTCCDGSRLRDDAGAMQFRDLTMGDICRLPLGKLVDTVNSWKLNQRETKIAGEVMREVRNRLDFLVDVGLQYLTLSRTAASLSNGEAQRIRLASQLGSGLCGVLYVLDEPTIGLHPRDNKRLLKALHRLRDLGNTLLVVEHDKEVIESADAIFDFGPKAGVNGGQIVAEGTLEKVMKKRASVTGPYLSNKKAIPIPQTRRPGLKPYSANQDILTKVKEAKTAVKKKKKNTKRKSKSLSAALANSIDVIGAKHNNLKNVNLSIPLETLTVITGPSGCGKSSLVNDILFNSLSRRLHRATATVGNHTGMRGVQHINKVIRVDQAPLGNTPSSNPATYTGVFELIRILFSQLPESKVRGFSPRRFSFNVPGGRCEECAGNGQICIEMHFLPDVWVECETCQGHRYNEETLAVKYHGYSINDVLEMSCGEALQLFKNIPKIRRIVQTLCDVGLDYVRLGQSAPTLSGGEAQRVKLAAELARPDTGRTLYLLDEPTTGLHFSDLEKLMEVLHRLVDVGNTVVLIEHNLDVIKNADWVIDMGPEAGQDGGFIVATGTPEQIVDHAKKAKTGGKLLRSYTGEALEEFLVKDHYRARKVYDPFEAEKEKKGDLDITEVGKDIAMPWERNGRAWHTSECVDRNGSPVKWDGRIVDQVVDRIQDLGSFADTDWNSRNVVEISGKKKSLGWFFHALTGESWMLKMKFRVRRNTFKKEDLQNRIPLLTLNQLDDIPLYGNDSRVKCKNLAGPWQEVEIRAHTLEELNRTEFWSFLEDAVKGFNYQTGKSEENIENHMPWKKLGRTWHFSTKGYSLGKHRKWDEKILEKLEKLINDIGGDVEWVWDNKVLAHFSLPESNGLWGTINTKKETQVPLVLYHPKDEFSFGEVADFGATSELDSRNADKDMIRIDFESLEQVEDKSLHQFLKKHFETVSK